MKYDIEIKPRAGHLEVYINGQAYHCKDAHEVYTTLKEWAFDETEVLMQENYETNPLSTLSRWALDGFED